MATHLACASSKLWSVMVIICCKMSPISCFLVSWECLSVGWELESEDGAERLTGGCKPGWCSREPWLWGSTWAEDMACIPCISPECSRCWSSITYADTVAATRMKNLSGWFQNASFPSSRWLLSVQTRCCTCMRTVKFRANPPQWWL